MTNTQTKVARLAKRVERIEQALEAIQTLADPYIDVQAPACVEAFHKIAEIVKEIRAERTK